MPLPRLHMPPNDVLPLSTTPTASAPCRPVYRELTPPPFTTTTTTATKPRPQVPGYEQNSSADDVVYFHGREVRQVKDAAGGMGFKLQLASAEGDPDGWTPQELAEYSGNTGGWVSDSQRTWRKGEKYEEEGFSDFRSKVR